MSRKKFALLTTFLIVACLLTSSFAQPAPAKVLFSKQPIDPTNPTELTSSFAAGDRIYSLMQFPSALKDLHKGKASFMVFMEIDGERSFYQYLELKSDEAKAASYVVLDIAPDPEKMTTYRDPGYGWGEGAGNKKLGPHGFTWKLGELAAGKHKVVIKDFDFGRSTSLGEFTIEGDDYSSYAELHQQIDDALHQVAKLPPAAQTNDELEAKMRALLESAGWKDILKINIVDKDWWLDRMDGGDTPIVSRHVAAAVAARDGDETCFYKVCTFHEQALITGGFGALELTHQGERTAIEEANIE